MMAQAARNKFGDIQPIAKDEWTREVTEGSKENWVIAYLWDDALEECKLMDQVLRVVAKNHRDVKFVSIQAQACIENWPQRYVQHGQMRSIWSVLGAHHACVFSMQQLPDALHVSRRRAAEPDSGHPQAWWTQHESGRYGMGSLHGLGRMRTAMLDASCCVAADLEERIAEAGVFKSS